MLSGREHGEVYRFAVKNAHDYGSASLSNVLNRALSAFPERRKDVKGFAKDVGAVVDEVNALGTARLGEEYKKFEAEFAEEKREKEEQGKPKFAIEGAEQGNVVTRFPPEPGGYIQVGNAKQCLMSDEIARIYGGRIYLDFDDTNPEKCRQKYVEGIMRDTEWLGVRFAKVYYSSDFIETVYDYGRKLIERGMAYACSCSQESMRDGRRNSRGCAHRNRGKGESLQIFGDMLDKKYADGEMTLRLKGDMESGNDTLRDPTLFRIKTISHFRHGDKYVVWPTYHMNTPIIDSINGVTDIIRSKEYEKWTDVHVMMLDALGLRVPRIHYEARLRIEGNTTAKREIRALIAGGMIGGWDDPRLMTIVALRRRGIQPEAIRSFVLRFGMSKMDGFARIDMLLAENKRVIDPMAKHLFFVENPVRLEIDGSPSIAARLKLGRNSDEFREYETTGAFYIPSADARSMKPGDRVTLKDLADVGVVSAGSKVTTIADGSGGRGRIVQWVPDDSYVECTVMVPGPLLGSDGNVLEDSLRVVKGYVEAYASNLDEHDIVQFERFGYCILDSKDEMRFIFISK